MNVITRIDEMILEAGRRRRAGETIGFVPTMGALHEGHCSLLQAARETCGTTVMSIFVNPRQFGPSEDFQKYPRPVDADLALAENRGCDIVFMPDAGEMYPTNYSTQVMVEGMTEMLCGASRPGHFCGVTTAVLKLLNIVTPDRAFFGQKDAQQALVIRRMAVDLNLPIRICISPTVRQPDGLAMSSRNAYLSAGERAAVPLLYKALQKAQTLFTQGEHESRLLKDAVHGICAESSLITMEYVEIVDTVTIQPVISIEETALVALACRTAHSGTRLIDNIVLGGSL